jgi:hypothetical protein
MTWPIYQKPSERVMEALVAHRLKTSRIRGVSSGGLPPEGTWVGESGSRVQVVAYAIPPVGVGTGAAVVVTVVCVEVGVLWVGMDEVAVVVALPGLRNSVSY